MGIKNINIGEVGLAGVVPRIIYIETDDTVASVLATGYLNNAKQNGFSFSESDMALVSTKTSPSASAIQCGWYEISISGSDVSLVDPAGPGNVTLPTVANYIAHFSDAIGTSTSDAANVINAGNIQAGLSGTSGALRSYPGTAARGYLELAAINNSGAFNVSIANAAHGQTSVYSIPDGGQATSEFIIADSSGTQHITSGALQIDGGSLSLGLAAGGTAGSLIAYSPTAAMGSLRLLAVDSAGDFAVTISNASHGQASVVSIPDGGQATSEFIIADSAGTQNITSGNLSVDAGSISSGLAAGGFAGSMIAYSSTAAMGSLRLLAVDSAGDFAVTISNASHGQASVVSIPDGGQATSEFIIADSAGTQNITSGNLSVDAGAISSGLAAGGFAGNLVLWANTTANGNLALLAVDNASGDFDTVISNAAAIGQDQTISIPDSGAATANFILSASSAAAQTISSGLSIVGDNNIQTSGGGQFIAGGDAAEGYFISYPATTVSGQLILKAIDNASGDFDTEINNAAAVGQDQVITIPDSGAATANFLLDAGAANILAHQEFVSLNNILIASVGTWTMTRLAQGDYGLVKTAADDTSNVSFDIMPAIRVAASKGFRLDSFDVIYSIATIALDAHTVTLDRIEYADGVAVSVNSIAITGALATATDANPYVTNVSVDAPAFDVTADSKYVVELTVDAAATTDYVLYGLMLRFSQTIG